MKKLLRTTSLPLLFALLFASQAIAQTKPKRLLMIVVDSLRADHLGVHGYDKPTSPTLDRLAREHTYFVDARSTSSWTKPAVASLFAGVDPLVHSVEKGPARDIRTGNVDALSSAYTTLAELFREAGFDTGAWSANPHIAAETGLDQGFDFLVQASNRGDDLTAKFLGWLKRSYRSSPTLRIEQSRQPSNPLLGWWRQEAEHSPHVREHREKGVRTFSLLESAGRREEITLPLGTVVPDKTQSYLVGLVYSARGGARATLMLNGQALRDFRFPARMTTNVLQRDLVLPAGEPAALSLSVTFPKTDRTAFEIHGAYLAPIEDEPPSESWFAYLHFMQTHLPYPAAKSWLSLFEEKAGTPRPLTERALKSLGHLTINASSDLNTYLAHYNAAIREVDQQIGLIVEALDRQGLLEETLVVITSDHGEEFLEHGRMNHSHTLYEESLKVPLILVGPGASKAESDAPTTLTDFAPSLAEIFGLRQLDEWSGTSWNRAASGAGTDHAPNLFTLTSMMPAVDSREFALYSDPFKLHLKRRRTELYDVRADPLEKVNLASQRPEEVERLKVLLEELRKQADQKRDELNRPPALNTLTEPALKELESLGYIDG